jgi:hypothetical protein
MPLIISHAIYKSQVEFKLRWFVSTRITQTRSTRVTIYQIYKFTCTFAAL